MEATVSIFISHILVIRYCLCASYWAHVGGPTYSTAHRVLSTLEQSYPHLLHPLIIKIVPIERRLFFIKFPNTRQIDRFPLK